jgi:hypothetical protein
MVWKCERWEDGVECVPLEIELWVVGCSWRRGCEEETSELGWEVGIAKVGRLLEVIMAILYTFTKLKRRGNSLVDVS